MYGVPFKSLLKSGNVTEFDNPTPRAPPAAKINNPNPDPGRSAAAGRENPQSKSASVGAGAVGAVVVVATRESRLRRQQTKNSYLSRYFDIFCNKY